VRALGLTVVLIFADSCIVQPPPQAPGADIVSYPTRQLELSNGLRVVLERAPDFGVAAAVLVVGAGAADERPGYAGLAHLVEHLACESKHGGLSFRERTIELGSIGNANTSWDDTTFYLSDDARNLDDIVRAVHGIVAEPLAGADEATFERERHVVSDEMRLRTEDGTPGQAAGWLMAAAFPRGHGYAHSVGGTDESLADLELADARAFVAAHYRAATSTLVVSAPLPVEEQLAVVERVTGARAAPGVADAPALAPRRPTPSAPAPVNKTFETRTADVPVPVLWIGWSVPGVTADSGDIAELAGAVIDNNVRIDLFKRDRDLAAFDSEVIGGGAASLLYVWAILKDGKHPEQTAQMIADEVGVRLGDFEALKRFTASKAVYREESMVSRARSMAWSSQHAGRPRFLRGLEARMVDRPWQAVLDYAHAHLGAERAHVVLVRPGPSESTAAEQVRTRPSLEVRRASSTSPPAAPVLLPAAISPPPRPAAERTKLLASIETHELGNGLQVILVPRPGSPFHTVVLGFRGGTAQATPPGVLVASRWGRQHFDWSPDVFGLNYRYAANADNTEEILRSTGNDVRLTMHYLGQLVAHQTFWPPQRFNDLLEVFEREEQAPQEALDRALARAFYGTSPLGAWPTSKEIQRIRPGEVLRWVDRVRRPRNAALVVVGDFEPRRALEAAEAELGGWGRTAGALPDLPVPPPLARAAASGDERVVVQDRPASLQAAVHFRCLLPPATADNLAARVTFRESIERILMRRLRQELGASYHVGVRTGSFVGGTAVLDLTADVDYARLADALRQLRPLFASEDAGTPLVDAATFELARAAAGRDLRLDTRELAVQTFRMWTLGWPLDMLDRLPEAARKVRPDDIADLAESCRANWVLGLLGDEQRVRAAWNQARR
jgi:zinc protease